MRKQFAGIASTLLIVSAVFGEENSCQIPKGLFERRSALISQVGTYQNRNAQSDELAKINEKYFEFMIGAASKEEPKGTQAGPGCCENLGEDPVADLVCKLSRYLKTERKDTKALLESVPTNPKGREALWALDDIAHLHASGDSETGSVPFGPYGPVTLYLDELYRLARSGDKEALSKYLGLYPYSDGEHAEQMDDQMEKLLKSDMDLVLREWEIFNRHRKALLKLRDSLPSDEKKALTKKLSANNACVTHSSACTELKTLLSE